MRATKTTDKIRQLDTINSCNKQATPSKKMVTSSKNKVSSSKGRVSSTTEKVTSSKIEITLSKKKITPSKKKVTQSKKEVNSSKKNFSPTNNNVTSKWSQDDCAINECFPPNIALDESDSEAMGDDTNNKLNQLTDPRKIIHKLCNSLNKSDLFEDEDEFIDDDEYDDRDNYTRAFLGSFSIYKSDRKCSTRLRPLSTYLYIPPFRVKENEMMKAGFWKDWEARLARNIDFSAEDIEEDLNNKIEVVIEHFKNFDSRGDASSEDCPAETLHKTNLNAPYLPTPHDLEALQSLKIKVDSSGHKWSDIPTTYCSNRTPKKKYGIFSRRESEKMRQNWEDFKKEYKFCDLRPLLGNRTYLLEGNAERFTYNKVQYLSVDQHFAFIKYLGRGLENRSLTQLYVHASNCLIDNVSNNSSLHKPLCSRELHLMDLFINKFGLSTLLMEFLLESKSGKQFARMLYRYYRFRHCPFNSGPWSSAEVLRLLDAISHYSEQPAPLQRTALPGIYRNAINWTQVMERVQTRSPDECGAMFHNLLKQALKSRYYSNAKLNENVQWTTKHELLLIKELCQTTADSLNRVDFYMLSTQPEFEPFCDDFLKRVAREVIHSRVPVSKRRYFDESLDYLAKEVIPLLSNKIEEHKEVFNTRYLSKANDILQVFPDYLNKYVIKMFSNLPLHESTNMAEAYQNIGNPVDERTDCDPGMASRTLPINFDAEETRGTVPRNSADMLSSQQNDFRPVPAAKRKRQHESLFRSSIKSKKKGRNKIRVIEDDVVLLPPAPGVESIIDCDVITLD